MGWQATEAPFNRGIFDVGGLLSQANVEAEVYRRSAAFAAKILNRAQPADIPFKQPTRFGLIITLRTIEALGHIQPPSWLPRADEVIE